MTRGQFACAILGFVILSVSVAASIWRVEGVASDAEQLAQQNRLILMAQRQQVEAIEAEAQQRQRADRVIIRETCRQQQFLYRVLKGILRADNRETRALLLRRLRVLRANGFTRPELRRAIAGNRRVLGRLRPLDCRDFAGRVSVAAFDITTTSALVIFEPRVDRVPPAGGGGGAAAAPPVASGGGGGPGGGDPPSTPSPGPNPNPSPPTGPGKGKSRACEHAPSNKHC